MPARVRLASALVLAALPGLGGAATVPAEPASEASAMAESIAAAAPRGEIDAAVPAAPVEGLWQRHEVEFRYVGLSTFYTCDSLARKLGELLEAAGAREDFRSRPRGCETGFDRVARFPSVRLEFHVLVPAPEPAAAAPAPPPERRLGRDAPKLVPAHVPRPGTGAWRTVELGPKLPRWLAHGDCELVEQFVRDVLPKFHTRTIEDQTRCVPYQRTGSQIRLRFEALGALPDADAPQGR